MSRQMIATLLSASLAASFPLAARAADDEPAEGKPAVVKPVEPAGEKPADDAAAKAAEKPAAVKKGKAPFARIADEEETIYAVQRKAYLVNHRLELTPMFSASFTDRFVQSFAPAASVTYHLAENFGVEAFGAYIFPSESGLTSEILDKGKLTPEIAKLTQMLWAFGLGVQWSPIYGKLQIFGSTLGNFNFYIGAGAAIGQTRVQCTPGLDLDPERGFDPAPDGSGKAKCPMLDVDPNAMEDVYKVVYEPARLQFMGAFSGGIRFYFSDWLGLKFEIKDYAFATRVFRPGTMEPTQRFTDAIRNNIYAQLGVSFLLGGKE